MGLPCGPLVKNLSCNVGDSGWIPRQGTKITMVSCAEELLSPRATTRENSLCFPSDANGKEPVCHTVYNSQDMEAT